MTMFYQLFQALFSQIGEDEAKQQGNVFASSPVIQHRKSESRLGPKIDLEEDIRRSPHYRRMISCLEYCYCDLYS